MHIQYTWNRKHPMAMVHLVWIQATRNTVLVSLTASSGVARLAVEPLGEEGRGVAATNTGDILNGTEESWGRRWSTPHVREMESLSGGTLLLQFTWMLDRL